MENMPITSSSLKMWGTVWLNISVHSKSMSNLHMVGTVKAEEYIQVMEKHMNPTRWFQIICSHADDDFSGQCQTTYRYLCDMNNMTQL